MRAILLAPMPINLPIISMICLVKWAAYRPTAAISDGECAPESPATRSYQHGMTGGDWPLGRLGAMILAPHHAYVTLLIYFRFHGFHTSTHSRLRHAAAWARSAYSASARRADEPANDATLFPSRRNYILHFGTLAAWQDLILYLIYWHIPSPAMLARGRTTSVQFGRNTNNSRVALPGKSFVFYNFGASMARRFLKINIKYNIKFIISTKLLLDGARTRQ